MVVSRSLFWTSLLAAGMVFGGAAHAADPPPAAAQWLKPIGKWEVNYAAAECRLMRSFATAERPILVEISRGVGLDSYRWALYGVDVPAYSAQVKLTLEFAPQTTSQRIDAYPYEIVDRPERAIKWTDADRTMTDAMRNDQRLRVVGGRGLDLRFDLPGMETAVKALEACQTDLLTSWGVDPTIAVKPEPANNAARWVTNDDYPKVEFGRKNEGMTTFLLDVSADGKATDCRIAVSSGWPALDKRTCELVLRRSLFRPARDASGKAVAGHYVNRVWWQVPR